MDQLLDSELIQGALGMLILLGLGGGGGVGALRLLNNRGQSSEPSTIEMLAKSLMDKMDKLEAIVADVHAIKVNIAEFTAEIRAEFRSLVERVERTERKVETIEKVQIRGRE